MTGNKIKLNSLVKFHPTPLFSQKSTRSTLTSNTLAWMIFSTRKDHLPETHSELASVLLKLKDPLLSWFKATTRPPRKLALPREPRAVTSSGVYLSSSRTHQLLTTATNTESTLTLTRVSALNSSERQLISTRMQLHSREFNTKLTTLSSSTLSSMLLLKREADSTLSRTPNSEHELECTFSIEKPVI